MTEGIVNEPYKLFHHYEAERRIMGITVFSGRAEDGTPSGDLVALSGSRRIISVFGREPNRSELLQAVRTLREQRLVHPREPQS